MGSKFFHQRNINHQERNFFLVVRCAVAISVSIFFVNIRFCNPYPLDSTLSRFYSFYLSIQRLKSSIDKGAVDAQILESILNVFIDGFKETSCFNG